MAGEEWIDIPAFTLLAGISREFFFQARPFLLNFPVARRKPGVSKKTWFDRSEVLAFLAGKPYQSEALREQLKKECERKAVSKIDNNLAGLFMAGGFDRPTLKKRHMQKRVDALTGTPKTTTVTLLEMI